MGGWHLRLIRSSKVAPDLLQRFHRVDGRLRRQGSSLDDGCQGEQKGIVKYLEKLLGNHEWGSEDEDISISSSSGDDEPLAEECLLHQGSEALGQLEPNHESFAAHLEDALSCEQFFESRSPPFTHIGGSFDEFSAAEDVEGGQCSRAGERSSSEGGGVHDFFLAAPGGHDLCSSQASADGEAPAQSFAQAEEVWCKRWLAFACQKTAAASEARPDLVRDDNGAVRVRSVLKPGEKAERWHEDTAATQDGFDHDGSHVAPRKGVTQLHQNGLQFGFVLGIWQEGHVLGKMFGKGGSIAAAQIADPERAIGEAMVAALKGDKAGLAGFEHRSFDRCGDRVRPTLPQDDLGIFGRMQSSESFEEANLRIAGVDVSQSLEQTLALKLESALDGRSSMSQQERAKAGGQIDISIGIDVDDVGAFASREDDGASGS